jgi:hypothetical protein
MAKASRVVTIAPLNEASGASQPIRVGLLGDASYTPAGGGSGWQVVDRPKRVGATQWYDRPPWSLSFEAMIDNEVIHIHRGFLNVGYTSVAGPQSAKEDRAESITNRSIESICHRIESWMNPVPGTLEPPQFTVTGPLPGTHHTWVLYSIEFGEALRDGKTGARYQQKVKMTFYEYAPPYGSLYQSKTYSPTDSFYYSTEINSGSASFQLYTIKKGDTLSRIAAKFNMGSPTSPNVQKFLQINNIRDPRSLQPGQTVILPNV